MTNWLYGIDDVKFDSCCDNKPAFIKIFKMIPVYKDETLTILGQPDLSGELTLANYQFVKVKPEVYQLTIPNDKVQELLHDLINMYKHWDLTEKQIKLAIKAKVDSQDSDTILEMDKNSIESATIESLVPNVMRYINTWMNLNAEDFNKDGIVDGAKNLFSKAVTLAGDAIAQPITSLGLNPFLIKDKISDIYNENIEPITSKVDAIIRNGKKAVILSMLIGLLAFVLFNRKNIVSNNLMNFVKNPSKIDSLTNSAPLSRDEDFHQTDLTSPVDAGDPVMQLPHNPEELDNDYYNPALMRAPEPLIEYGTEPEKGDISIETVGTI